MLLANTATAVLVALLVSLVGWGAWAALFKSAKKARYEYFIYDFGWGAGLLAVAAAFTLGSWDSNELTFQDNFLLTGLRKIAWAALAGLVFNLANSLLLGAVSVSGMAVAFPVAFGLAWAVGGVSLYFTQPGVNPALAAGGAITILTAVGLCLTAYRWYLADREARALEALKTNPQAKPAPKGSAAKPFALAAVAGALFCVFFPVIEEAVAGDNGVSAYGAALIVAAAIAGSSLVYVPFLLNFPVKGKPLTVRQYFKVEGKHHLLGVLAGAVWMAGLLGALLALTPGPGAQTGELAGYIVPRSAPLLALLLGLMWGEFRGAPVRVQAMLGAVFVLMLAGLGLVALAPLTGG